MDLLKTPSIQSLLDSDLESVESLQYLDIEELDEVEYALPISEAPTLAQVLSAEDDNDVKKENQTQIEDPSICSALQVEFLQAVSQQLLQAQDRSSAGTATALSIGTNGKLTVGTAHGHVLSFHDQTLRWVCDVNADCGAVSCLCYNHDSTRLLSGHARGLIFQYESTQGIVLRKVTLGGEIWGILRVVWAGTSGLALDTGGSVWLIKFSRPLGVRAARTSCLFSGARGEVVAMAAKDARILALATLSRVIIVAGGHAAGLRLSGSPDTLPVVAWCETDDRMLVSARGTTLQWLLVDVTGSAISLRTIKTIELKSTPLWLGWLSGYLAIFDSDENLRLWGDDYDKPLDLSHIEPVYASAFFKGVWTDGRVSGAMRRAGDSAVGGASVADGTLALLGRKGVIRVRVRDTLARTRAYMAAGRHAQALRLLYNAQGADAKALAAHFIALLSERPHVLSDKNLAKCSIQLCLKYNLSEELWLLWEQCSGEDAFVEAIGEAAARGALTDAAPSPDCSQTLIERLADVDPTLIERVIVSLPLTSLDPHRASVFARSRGLWSAVGAIAALLGGGRGAMRTLAQYVCEQCAGSACTCAGAALIVATADALAGRAAGGRPLPDHKQPSARHDALHALLAEQCENGRTVLSALLSHDARATVRMLEQSAREPPFAGPLAKQNRLRVARALLSYAPAVQDPEGCVEILEFIVGQLNNGFLPLDRDLINNVEELAGTFSGERADRAWAALVTRAPNDRVATKRDALQGTNHARRAWLLDAHLRRHGDVVTNFLLIENPSHTDIEEFFKYLQSNIEADDFPASTIDDHTRRLIELCPHKAFSVIGDRPTESLASVLRTAKRESALEFGECLLAAGRLTGDAAAVHFENLCRARPADVTDFLEKHHGLVRPEDALRIVRITGLRDVEPACLEAVGDVDGALDAILGLIAPDDKECESRLIGDAAALCARVSPGVPAETAAGLWVRVLRRANGVPPALLLEATAYLSVDALIEWTCGSARVALTLLQCASGERSMWECASRLSATERHEALARALRAARRGVAVRGRCARCDGRLETRAAIRTTHCSRAVHADCEPERVCGACGQRLTNVLLPLPLVPASVTLPSSDHALLIAAPPRPDLEGLV